tara:strand:+ start:382 stop:588 length:207 start_codon:yes stop_codon:yes gene_type:complete
MAKRKVKDLIIAAITEDDADACAKAAYTLRRAGFNYQDTFKFFARRAGILGREFEIQDFEALLIEADV